MNAKILMIASAFVIFMLGIGSVSAQNAPPPPDAAAATAPAEAAPPAAGAPATRALAKTHSRLASSAARHAP